jgi:hypothetical protein
VVLRCGPEIHHCGEPARTPPSSVNVCARVYMSIHIYIYIYMYHNCHDGRQHHEQCCHYGRRRRGVIIITTLQLVLHFVYLMPPHMLSIDSGGAMLLQTACGENSIMGGNVKRRQVTPQHDTTQETFTGRAVVGVSIL